ncbi:Rieske (2Fe-2S) protein [Actinomycetospora endophytica]|uniref:Cytochrome bc1 complex Rieske iron-sulfur subunit n=1 Tax=Actinomycetospora endophytica TaxID=2291215 RepID=A0ABS8PB89_9PSEU|nr:Rieske (2Fe-2S) protein [Actinomycetospora endophytica]MCD2195522.1 Rieske (2Fe-2S) protein [Actinomycetospora endophytica]
MTAGEAPFTPGRRTVLLTGCAGLAALGLAGCAEYGNGAAAPAPTLPVSVATSDVPVGGGVVLAGQGAVVAQPVAGTFTAFGTTCPHQGCAVNAVADGTINCPCHGSRFHLADGSVAQGPAERGLTPRAVRVADGRVDVT